MGLLLPILIAGLAALSGVAGYSFSNMLPRLRRLRLQCEQSPSPEPAEPERFSRWTNPAYAAAEVEGWWRELGDAMLSLGDRGLQSSHRNALLELLATRDRVRIKFSSDRVDQMAIAEALMADGGFSAVADVLEVRRRGLMVGRKAGLAPRSDAGTKKPSHGMCLDFFAKGHTCELGARCRFSHDPAGLTRQQTRTLLEQHLGSLSPPRKLDHSLLKTL